jgi:RNA polymerase sigma-70 factor (ECF subfamily)
MDERALVAAFLDGNENAFDTLYAAHAPALYAFLRRLVRDEADDALQEVWLRAARDLRRFRWQSSFRTWLFGIAVNRSREIGRLIEHSEELPEVAGEEDPVLDRIDLERAVGSLPLRYREVVVLHDIYEHTHAEIGALLGIDEGTSKSNLSRARASLRKWIGEP